MIKALSVWLEKLFLSALIFTTIKHAMALVLLIATVNKFDHFLAEHKIIILKSINTNDLMRQIG